MLADAVARGSRMARFEQSQQSIEHLMHSSLLKLFHLWKSILQTGSVLKFWSLLLN